MRTLLPDAPLLVATHNSGKAREILELLGPYVQGVKTSAELGLSEPEETGATFEENALIKAREAARQSGMVALADDSGLSVSALGGAPGIYSARWAGPTKDFSLAMERVQRELGESPDRSACFVCVLALAWPDGTSRTFEGRVDGTIIWPPRGEKGFGYDPIFVPQGYSQTFAEMDPEQKHRISHRARAFEKLVGSMG
ncbi:MAG: RdgB/HAM1 family non-canonical purine NTP pyrophosphatase [Alphaproteobacteria bacterium]|nr:RdgB/HAM1 family non-canonical purine NTP pyrophosphatase [Alphaproteobacteria bacterium]QQS56758.1 MAG: RdgB/HAM1 family non-canonical purine NTP pyrophosphatase [Alphaproteobacteria bacterium]